MKNKEVFEEESQMYALKSSLILFIIATTLFVLSILIERSYGNILNAFWKSIIFKISVYFIIVFCVVYVFYILYQKDLKFRTYKAYFNDMFTDSPEPMLIIDKNDLSIIDANKSALNLLEYDKDRIRKLKFLEFIKKENRLNVHNEILSLNNTQQTITQIEIIAHHFNILFCNLTFKPVEDPIFSERLIVSIQNITDIIEYKYKIELFKIKIKQYNLKLNDLFLKKLSQINFDLITLIEKTETGSLQHEKLKLLVQDFDDFKKEYQEIFSSFNDKLFEI